VSGLAALGLGLVLAALVGWVIRQDRIEEDGSPEQVARERMATDPKYRKRQRSWVSELRDVMRQGEIQRVRRRSK
jgi:type IV secretory pathway TrbF-like protein